MGQGWLLSKSTAAIGSPIVRGLKLLTNGQIVVGASDGNKTGSLVARYNANGTLDSTFGSDNSGYYATSTGEIQSMALDSSGRILLCGEDNDPVSGNPDAAVFRFTAQGLPDPTFGTNGESSISPPGYTGGSILGIGVQSTGQIVVTGPGSGLFRLNDDGSLDKTFGSNGFFMDSHLNVLAVQPNDEILVAGGRNDSNGGSDAFLVYEVLAGGQKLDPNFGTAGQTVPVFGGVNGTGAFGIVIGTDNKITISGHIRSDGGADTNGLARFVGNPRQNDHRAFLVGVDNRFQAGRESYCDRGCDRHGRL